MNSKLQTTLKILGIVPTMLFSASLLLAQNTQVKGTIVDGQSNSPIAGATIKVLGTSKASSSDASGVFQVNVDDKNRILSIVLLGMKPKP